MQFVGVFLLSLFLALANALHLEVSAAVHPLPVCIRDFVAENQMVVVNIHTSGRVGDGQQLDLSITDSMGNEYRSKKNIAGSVKVAFTSHNAAAFDVCFANYQDKSWKNTYLSREIELDIESGAAARDWNAVQAAEKLKPQEVELRRVQQLTEEISTELNYLKAREERMRDTNESTNSRVKWFSLLIIASLIGLGGWQIQYLRHYFKVKHII
jgi:hypothetical protein